MTDSFGWSAWLHWLKLMKVASSEEPRNLMATSTASARWRPSRWLCLFRTSGYNMWSLHEVTSNRRWIDDSKHVLLDCLSSKFISNQTSWLNVSFWRTETEKAFPPQVYSTNFISKIWAIKGVISGAETDKAQVQRRRLSIKDFESNSSPSHGNEWTELDVASKRYHSRYTLMT